jgi:hypothetical protein
MAVDLSTCVKGQKLLSSHGEILVYVKSLPAEDFYDHLVEYRCGSQGTRTNDGYVYRNIRKPKYDHDIVEILGV